MAYYHGVKTREIETAILGSVESSAGLPVVVGTAPKGDFGICYNFEEFEAKFGYSEDWNAFDLCEMAYSEFKIYGVKPVVFINVYDENKHFKVTNEETGSYEGDVSKVTAEDIISGISRIKEVYVRYGLTPGLLICPKWSIKAGVAAAMTAAVQDIDSIFNCIALTDVDTTQVKKYDDVKNWKENQGYTNYRQVVCWPMIGLDDKVFHMSVAMAGVIGIMDAENGDVPYMSPSNHQVKSSGLKLADGEDVIVTFEQANLLNSQGIITALNFIGGYKLWGNRMADYPTNTDPKSFLCVRRMFDWQRNTFILQYWQKVDAPLTQRVVKTIIDTEELRLNGLVSRGYLLGAGISYREEENPLTDLIAGKLRLHVLMTPPVPAEMIEEIAEFDVSAYEKLMG